MKKFFVSVLTLMAAICLALGFVSCSKVLDTDLGEYDWSSEPVFEDEYDGDMQIDGELNEARWTDRKWLYHTGSGVDVQYTTAFSEYGVYFAGIAYDPDITWYGRYNMVNNSGFTIRIMLADNTTKSNTAILRLEVDAYDRRSYFQSRFSAATQVDGEVDSGACKSMTTEMFISWKALGVTEADKVAEGEIPEAVKIEPTYRKIIVESEKKRYYRNIFPTFTDLAHGFMWTWPNFGADGYTNADEEGAYMGMAKNGIAKTDGWDTSAYKTDGTVRTTGVSSQAIFFKEVDAENFVAKATVKANGLLGSPDESLFGMIASKSFETCRAAYVSYSKMKDSKKLVVSSLTYYPNRFQTKSDVSYKNPHTFGDTVELEYIKYGDEIYFLVDGLVVYTDKQDWYGGAFSPGLYAYGCDATFSNLSATAKTDEEMESYLKESKLSRIVVSANKNGTVATNTYLVKAGGNVKLTLQAETGCVLSGLAVNGDALEDAYEKISDGTYVFATSGTAQTQNIVATFTKLAADDTNKSAPLYGKLVSSSDPSRNVEASVKITSSYPFLYYEDSVGTGGYKLNYLPKKGTVLTVNGEEIVADGKYTVAFSAPYYRTLEKEYVIDENTTSTQATLTITDIKGKAAVYELPTVDSSVGTLDHASSSVSKTLPAMLQYSTKEENATSTDGLAQRVLVAMRASVSDFSDFVSLRYTVYEENSNTMIAPVLYDRDGSAYGIGGASISDSQAVRTDSGGFVQTRKAADWHGVSVAGGGYSTYEFACDDENVYYWENMGLVNDDGELNKTNILDLAIAIYAYKGNNYTVSFGDIYGVKADGSTVKVFDAANVNVIYAERGTQNNAYLNTGAGNAKLFFFAPPSSSTNTVNYQLLSKVAARTVEVLENRADMWQLNVKEEGTIWQTASIVNEKGEYDGEYIDLTYHDAVCFTLNTSEMTAGKTLSVFLELRYGAHDWNNSRAKKMYLLADNGTVTRLENGANSSYFALPAGFKGKVIVLLDNFDYFSGRKISAHLANVQNTIRFVTKATEDMDGELFKIEDPQFISNGKALIAQAQA